jgi:predicted dehydrogenase
MTRPTSPELAAPAGKIGVGIIGYGYWGPNLVRNFADTPGARVVAVSDLRAERLETVQSRYPSVKTTNNHDEIIHDPAIDAVVIVTPVSTHFALAKQALDAGKHVMVAKPITASSDEAQKLIELSERRQRVLLVDHTFIYTGAVRKIKEMVSSGQLGQIYYYDSVRVNLGLFQHDVNVLWDLAVHDLSIMDYILGMQPRAVSATGIAHVKGKPENVAYMTCFFEANVIAHFHVNWLAPVKIRRTLIGGDRQMIVYDDLEPDEKIKVYDKGINVDDEPGIHKLLVSYRMGEMRAPQLELKEALAVETAHFIDCITKGARPLTDGRSGLRLVKVLEAANQSLAAGGKQIAIQH